MLSFVGRIFFASFTFLCIVQAQLPSNIICVESLSFNTTIQIPPLCIPFLRDSVFVNTTFQSVDTTIASTLKSLQLAPHNCAVKAIELTCQTYFPSCEPIFFLPFPLPSPACKFKCREALKECELFAEENREILKRLPPSLPSSCDVEDNGMERWPESNATYNVLGMDLHVPCNSYSTEKYVDTNPYACPFPMHGVDDPSSSEDPCLIKCPLPFFEDHDWERDMKISYSLAWISFFCCLFLIISFMLNKTKRAFPQNLFINLFFACLVISICIISGTLGDWKKLFCHNGKPSTQSYSPCGAQGSIIFYFAISASCWWFSIVLNLFIMVKAKTKTPPYQHIKYYYIFSYGYPGLMTIIALSLKGFGYYSPNIICFLPVEGPKEWMQYALYYGPVMALTFVGAILNILIIYTLLKSYFRLGASVERSAAPYYKVSFFAVGFLFVWIALFTRMGVAKNAPVRNSLLDFVACHISSFSNNLDSISTCGRVPQLQPAINILRTQYVAMTVHGLLSFLLFCYDEELYTVWPKLYKDMKEKIMEKIRAKQGVKRRVVELNEVTNNSEATNSEMITERERKASAAAV